MFHLHCIILSENCCDKNAEAAENGRIFPLDSFFLMLCHAPQNCTWSTPSRNNQGQSLLHECVQFQHFSLHCFWQLSVDLQNLVKINGVP
jgi:hypothetical protein